MPHIIIEGEIPENYDGFTTYQLYNCLDSCITAQLYDAMLPKLSPNHLGVYEREMRLQSLCLEMSTKGFPVDGMALTEMLWQLEKDERWARSCLDRFCDAIGHAPLNPNSPLQVAEFFYDFLRLPVVWEFDRKTSKRKRSTDRKAMEKLSVYPIAQPFINALDAAKTAAKMASVFKRGLEPVTGNLRCNFSPSGTETGRLSSQQNPYGRGTNAQNLTDKVRQVITAPEGFVIVNLDLKTAESIAVGFISGDRGYIDACLGGDLHTTVARLNWKGLPWTGDLKHDKALAEQPYYRQFSYRDMAKRGGHGTNYYGTPRTMASHLKLPTKVLEEFQQGYFEAFPGIPEWHLSTIATIQTSGIIVTPAGRERRFWGRPEDPTTHREAIAYAPQSLVADVWNEGLMNLQHWVLRNAKGSVIDLRAQVHDSGVFLLPISEAHDLIPLMQEQLKFPIDFGALGTMVIPTDATVGKRWNKKPKRPGNDRASAVLAQGQRDYTPGMSLVF